MVLALPLFDLLDLLLFVVPNDLLDFDDLTVGPLESLRIAADRLRISDSSLSSCVDEDMTSAMPEYPLNRRSSPRAGDIHFDSAIGVCTDPTELLLLAPPPLGPASRPLDAVEARDAGRP